MRFQILADRGMDGLATLLRDAGQAGGVTSISTYDTAQVMRLLPTRRRDDSGESVSWLRAQQRDDGSWGESVGVLARDASTLAAVVALRALDGAPRKSTAIRRGMEFARSHAEQWSEVDLAEMPLAAELVIPKLVDDARALGLKIDGAPYRALAALRAKRLGSLRGASFRDGDGALHSWEAWGTASSSVPAPGRLGVGISPAATAAWLRGSSTAAGHGSAQVTSAQAAAESYLDKAAAAARPRSPAAVPPVWPIDLYEMAFVPFALMLADLHGRAEFAPTLRQLGDQLQRALTSDGLGAARGFEPDSDDTAAALCVLGRLERRPDVRCLQRFARGASFACFAQELNGSLVGAARCTLALRLAGQDTRAQQSEIAAQQRSDGRWPTDKWHRSWLYTSLHAVVSLAASEHRACVERAIDAVLAAQRGDGGWGSGEAANTTETAYGILTLTGAPGIASGPRIDTALARGRDWLVSRAADLLSPVDGRGPRLWVEKEDYRVPRVDRAFELTALLKSLAAERTPVLVGR